MGSKQIGIREKGSKTNTRCKVEESTSMLLLLLLWLLFQQKQYETNKASKKECKMSAYQILQGSFPTSVDRPEKGEGSFQSIDDPLGRQIQE